MTLQKIILRNIIVFHTDNSVVLPSPGNGNICYKSECSKERLPTIV